MLDELRTGDPTTLGSYRVLGRLGESTVSVVYVAEDAKSSRFAVKLLKPPFAGDEQVSRRLSAESNRILSVTGQNTARVLEIARGEQTAYLVTEYVEGDSLERLMASGRRIQGPLLWFIASGLAQGVREIHTAGLVHGDLKPSNVIVGTSGVKITDFGLRGILDAVQSAQGRTPSGSNAFMLDTWPCPEQLKGDAIDGRADIFNLGATLAFVALGRHPFASGPDSGGRTPLSERILGAAPDIESIAPAMRGMLARCLSIDPADRPRIRELESFFSSAGVDPITQPIPIVPSMPDPHPIDRSAREPEEETPPSGTSSTRMRWSELPALTGDTVSGENLDPESRGEVSMVDHLPDPILDSAYPRRRRGRTIAAVASVVVAVAVAAAAAVDVTNVVDLGIIGSAATTTTTSSTTTTTAAPTTTVPPTTAPPPPVYRLYEVDGNRYRWNPCQNPISIILNPMDKLTPAQLAAFEGLLAAQAAELSTLTGMTIEYSGLTQEKSGRGYTYGEEILIHIDLPGEGILEDDRPFVGTISGDRIKDGFREIDAVQFQYNANAIDLLFTGDELRTYGQWLVMLMLGNALGLNALGDADMTASGSADPAGWEKEIMYYGGRHLDTPAWGPGDTQGLAAVGASLGCF